MLPIRDRNPSHRKPVVNIVLIGGFVAGPLLLLLLGGFRRPAAAERSAWS